MSERFFYCREEWITGRLSRRLANALPALGMNQARVQEACALGLLCKVGFTMYIDSEQWTKEEIDEISVPGFCDALLKVGLAVEKNGFIDMQKVTPSFNREIYNEMNAARMRANRKAKKDAQRSNACDTCEQSVHTVRTEESTCRTQCAQRATECVIEEKREEENLNLAHTQTRASAQGRPIPEDAEEVFMFLKNQPHCGLSEEETRQCATVFFLEQESLGWVGPRGGALRDWKALAHAYFTKWQNGARNAFTATRARNKRPTLDPRETLPDAPF